DSGHIQEEDIKYVNKINRRKHRPQRCPLYTRKDAEDSLQYFSGIEYNRNTPITDDIQCCFYEAGHILGSSIVVLEIKTGPDKPPLRLAYAVDLGRKDLPILKDPQVPEDIDYLIIESTYGNRLHEDMEEVKGKLAAVINRTVDRGGKVIIPSFAMERTQEVVYFINQLLSEGLIPDLPIFVDSPLAINVTEIFGRHPECFDKEMMDQMLKGQNPFGFGRINYTRDVAKSKKLHSDPRPMIIISASGMCENGRILHHLKNNIEDPKNSILIVGFMAANTLGRKLVEKQPVVRIFGEEYQRRAEIVKLNAFSAHADKDELMEYVSGFNEKLKKIFIVHGEEEQSKVLCGHLNSKGFNSCLPRPGEEIEL
ncbi:MAG: MBL fold metallo-hydrolase, partial [Candidatus Omnitrophica bacterium]|nr:MBL fold metallo-hydrolase [Candidatus Omnitrophota bacterium]